jgi:radical SAM superfamily enzyme YgiQ (UPF0313 family)
MKLTCDVVFVAPPLLWGQERRLDLKPPLNLLYLASYVNARGWRAAILDVLADQSSLPRVLDRLDELQPRFLGVPFYQSTVATALRLCREARQRLPRLPIIAGGPLATTSPEELLQHDCIDLCVLGEGELTVEALLRLPEHFTTAALHAVTGIAFRENGAVVRTPARAPIAELDSLPFLDGTLVNLKAYYDFQESLGMPRWFFLSTSRGCPFCCVFCATPVLWPGALRRVTVERLKQEIEFQRSVDPGVNLGFMDDCFFSDKQWLGEFFAMIAPFQLKYCCIGRADHLTPDDVDRLAATGCHYVALGVESGNQAFQKKIKKYLNLDSVRKSIERLAKTSIATKCFFMLGFPDETPEEMLQTINFAIELKRLGMTEGNFFPVSVYPGTQLAEQVPAAVQVSAVYESFDFENLSVAETLRQGGDIGEKRLSIYANLPAAQVNRYCTQAQLVEIIKWAYQKLERAEFASLKELQTFL